jgi:hypothetical protein
MLLQDKQNWIRRKAEESKLDLSGDRILWSRHATAKLVDLSLSRAEVERALAECVVIEDYEALHRPLPDCLVLAFLDASRAIHAVLAIDKANDRIFVVTIYIPAKDRWRDDQRTRK